MKGRIVLLLSAIAAIALTASRIAAQTGGAVVTMTRPADEQLAAQVNAVVAQTVWGGARDIAVVIKNGVVTLQGRIPTEGQRAVLDARIKALPGVDRVQDTMITGPP